LENDHNIILTGAPGTGKTFLAQQVAEYFAGKEYVKKIQFHPSYDYTDLVEGMRPSGNNSFSRVDGSFKRFCKCAILGLNVNVSNKELADKEKGYTETIEPSKDPYVFIIDEINRGEVSKIFGEVFFCIEESHRGKEEAMDTQYQNLVPDGDLFKKGFYVPDNVYVIGTMNDIDRSVESMDFAFRRRFAFIEIEATTNMLDSIDIDESQVIEDLKKQMKALNNKIIEPKYGLSTAYQIGGAYFLKFEKYYSAFNNNEKFAYKALWDNHLKGTLFEYFRVLPQEDRKKYMTEMEKAFLGDYYVPKNAKKSKEVQPADNDNNDGQK
jgi:5-methylcytosine-specific restriction endonuclease McrBC GTP-binding regulatory subunit McrB